MGTSTDQPHSRGRPPAWMFTPEEVAIGLGVDVRKVLRALELEKGRKEYFPGAKRDGDSWRIPERDVARLVRPASARDPWPLRSVREFADLMGWSVSTTYERIRAGVVKHRMVLGEIRVPLDQYWDVPEYAAALPESADRDEARRAFFAQKVKASNAGPASHT